MGCGASTAPSDTEPTSVSETPVETLDLTHKAADPVTPEPAVSRRQPDVTPSKQRDNAQTVETVETPGNKTPIIESPSDAFVSSPLAAEQQLRNPFAREEPQIGMGRPSSDVHGTGAERYNPQNDWHSSGTGAYNAPNDVHLGYNPSNDMHGAGGYIKQKDVKKRGGFDPEKFRLANGRGLGDSAPMNPQPLGFSGNNNILNSSAPPQQWGAAAWDRPGAQMGGQPMKGPVPGAPYGGAMGGGPTGSMYGQQQQQQQQQWQPGQPSYIPTAQPQVLEFHDNGSQPRPTYDSFEEHSSARSPAQALNRTDEQELEDILQEMGEF
eukprot:TRINITY_DN15282_c0_g1_i1.p1 TRINITY_DN15282_c0_g1~~TRINITY_DN15282_c0_g1_i1.p1  ORF type:complete len:323 (-),score=65.63 TRINITY_DN15282_c0_g1_i1:341-1309(-)